MKAIFSMIGSACLLLLVGAAHASPPVSHFPTKELGLFLAKKFDLATIRSSFGPRRTPALRTFADFGIKPSSATDDTVVFDRPGDWYYVMYIVARRDVNGDGIEDLEVCFVDRAMNGGSYDTAQGLLVTRYTSSGYAIALSFIPREGICANGGVKGSDSRSVSAG
jgi:hypothetical protein